eukprot:5268026-Pyramimonas_sp.AAC.1
MRNACKQDKTVWVDTQFSTGSWDALKKRCRPKPRRQGRLRNMSGKLVENTQRAETMAEYLEKVQRKGRTAELLDVSPGDYLPASEADFTKEEVGKAIEKLKRGKASGVDDVPAEYWKAIATDPGGLEWITNVCNKFWNEEAVLD